MSPRPGCVFVERGNEEERARSSSHGNGAVPDPTTGYEHSRLTLQVSDKGPGRLADRTAVITGGDSRIGRAVALAYAREGVSDHQRHHPELTGGLAQLPAEEDIRVNRVAPGPIWTPPIPSTMPPEKVKEFGSQVPMKRPRQPKEPAPVCVMSAEPNASYVSGATWP